MSKQYPECPLYNHINCRECYNPKICAIVNEDKECLKKKGNTKSKAKRQEPRKAINGR
jgi:hypothetical protein